MKIVVNHLTRMQMGRICVAGVDLATGKHVRPLWRDAHLSMNRLARNGGLFDMACTVDLGPVSYSGRAPEVEDYIFIPPKARRLPDLPAAEFWELLSSVSQTSLGDIFGAALTPHGETYVVGVGTGLASLGCLRPAQPPELAINATGRIRLKLSDSARTAWLTVTDLRLYQPDLATPRHETVRHVARRLAQGAEAIVSVGLTRPWQKPGEPVSRHWLQVNNIHLKDDPLWRLKDERQVRPVARDRSFDVARGETR